MINGACGISNALFTRVPISRLTPLEQSKKIGAAPPLNVILTLAMLMLRCKINIRDSKVMVIAVCPELEASKLANNDKYDL